MFAITTIDLVHILKRYWIRSTTAYQKNRLCYQGDEINKLNRNKDKEVKDDVV